MEGYYTQNRQLFYYNGIVTNISFVFENTPAYKRLSRKDDKSAIGTALVNVIELSLLMTSNIFKAYDGVCFQSSFSILYYEAIRSWKIWEANAIKTWFLVQYYLLFPDTEGICPNVHMSATALL